MLNHITTCLVTLLQVTSGRLGYFMLGQFR